MASDHVGDAGEQRAPARVFGDVQRGVAGVGTEPFCYKTYLGIGAIQIGQSSAFALVGVEPDDLRSVTESFPCLGESPPATDVDNHQRLLEQPGEGRSEIGRHPRAEPGTTVSPCASV